MSKTDEKQPVLHTFSKDLLFRFCNSDNCDKCWQKTSDGIPLAQLQAECEKQGVDFNHDLFDKESPQKLKPTYVRIKNPIHWVCAKHHLEMTISRVQHKGKFCLKLVCPMCENYEHHRVILEDKTEDELFDEALALLNKDEYKNAKIIRLDDFYYPEIQQKRINNLPSNYWAAFDVKQDKNGQTIIVLYVGNNDKKSKSQFFIKPEHCQLSHDHNDSDPNTCLTKIEVTLKDRVLKQEYVNKN